MNRTVNTYRHARLILYLLSFCSVSVILFVSSFDRGFISDDYCTLNFLAHNEGLLVPGFFRPVGDLTLKWSLQVFGWNAKYFHFLNALLHGINSWLVFLVCKNLARRNNIAGEGFAVTAAIIFLFYHSLGEVVFWAIGRGISLAVTFSLTAMLIFLAEVKDRFKYPLVCLCYFLAISSYESALLLPLVMLYSAWKIRIPIQYGRWVLCLIVTAVLNLMLRGWFIGKLWAPYKGVVFAKNIGEYTTTLVKTLMRLFVPAIDHPVWFSALAFVVVVVSMVLVYKLFIRSGDTTTNRRDRYFPMVTIGVAGILTGALIAMFFGASTRTTEGDRLLYYPAVFFSMFMSALVMQINRKYLRLAAIVLISMLQCSVVILTMQNWNRAWQQSSDLISSIKQISARPLYLVNLPSDYKGAYQFRNCFFQHLQFTGVDTAGIVVVNVLKYPTGNAPHRIALEKESTTAFIWPETTINYTGDVINSISTKEKNWTLTPGIPMRHLLYWNRTHLESAMEK